MQLSKYYTPDTEELKLGLECEIFGFEHLFDRGFLFNSDNKEWNEGVLDINALSYIFSERNLNTLKIRVKCLDSKDLEELGWIIDFISDDIIHCRFIENAYYFLTLGLNSTVIISYKDEVLFNGKIKNKSELKWLMKALSIA